MKNFTAFIAGLLFGCGLIISQMVNPAKVRAFLDVFGQWDPSLAFVMGAALLVTAVGYRLVLRRSTPFLGDRFHLPTRRDIDARLMIGAACFGIGWGLVGLCPGPAITDFAIGGAPILIFLAAMAAGMGLFEIYDRTVAKAA